MNTTNLVDGVASNGREAELLDELFPDVLDVALAGTDLQGLLLGSLEVLLLANIGHESNHLIALFLIFVSDCFLSKIQSIVVQCLMRLTKRYFKMQLVSRPPE